MEIKRFKINNKEKQSQAGNWGKPDAFEQKHTKIPNPLYPPKSGKKRKKKKRSSKDYIFKDAICPFCKNELPIDKIEKQRQIDENKRTKKFGYSCYLVKIFTPRIKKCPYCKARLVKHCPCCKNKTWFRKGIYKHQYLSCGFIGAKK